MKPEARARVLVYLRRGLHRSDAAKSAGITYKTLREWMLADSAFCAAVLEAEAKSVTRLAKRIERHSLEDWKAAAWLLERRHPKRYGKRDRVEQRVTFENLSDEELKARATELAKKIVGDK